MPPLATGSVPLTCVVSETPLKVPPRVRVPVEVTEPVSVMPLTVPDVATEVTVPVFEVKPDGLVAAYAPREVNAAPAVVAPVPPLATGSVPLTCVVSETPDSVPPSVKLPVVVTVPVSVMPLTVPVPPTDVTVPTNASVALIVIVPAPLVMLTFVPAVSVALASVPPVVLPISSCPLVYVDCPVPPLATASVPVMSVLGMVAEAVMAVVPVPLTYPVSVAAPVPPLATASVPVTCVVRPILPHAGAPLTPPEIRELPVATSASLDRAVVVEAYSRSPTA